MQSSFHHVARAAMFITAICLTAVRTSAGRINPPSGAVSPTPGPEPRTAISAANTPGDTDSLFNISQPGSYYLTGNITGVVGKHGIEITASGVTVDLNGFDLTGIPSMGLSDGVTTAANLRNIAIVNGSVRNWGDEGIDLRGGGNFNCRVEGVLAHANAGDGIAVCPSSTVSHCSAMTNLGRGISAGSGCVIANCVAYQNTGNGIDALNDASISWCTTVLNTGTGISVAFNSTVSNCSGNFNQANGVSSSGGSSITNCTASSNGGIGVGVGNGSTVTNCSVTFNSANGISAASSTTIADCSTRSNFLDGIVCESACMIRGNTCSNDGNGAGSGAGIRAAGFDNRIEANNCTGADRGVEVSAGGNIIIKNTCQGNTINWVIVEGNAYGPIVATPSGAAVNGDMAPAALGSTDPNANFTY